MQPLGTSFTPGPSDVILGRGKQPRTHPGNIKFQEIIEKEFLARYSKAESRTLKSQIVAEIVSLVRRNSPGGGFVKCTDGMWHEVGDHLAREKVSQSLRDALDFKYESAAKTKRKKRADMRNRGPDATTLVPPAGYLSSMQPGLGGSPAKVSPETPGRLLQKSAALSLTGMGSAAASGMALADFYLRRRCPNAPIPNLPPPPPPPLYHPTRGVGGDADAPDASRTHWVPKLPALVPQESSQGSTEAATRPEDFIAACDQLPDSALLKTDPKVLNAYCTIMASIKRKGNPEDVLLTDLMLRRTLFKE